MVDRGHVDERAAGERHVRRDAHALVGDLVLRDLHDELLPLAEELVDGGKDGAGKALVGHGRGAVGGRRRGRELRAVRRRDRDRLRRAARPERVEVVDLLPDVGDVEERVLLEADVHERRLHAGEDARDAPLVDVSDGPALLAALDLDLRDAPVLEDGDARLAVGAETRSSFGTGGCGGRQTFT